MRILLTIICSLIGFHLAGQDSFDLTGEWNGTALLPGGQAIQLHYDFKQQGLLLDGFGFTKNLSATDSAKFKINGVVKGENTRFQGVEFIYKVGMACLAVTELKYIREEGKELLRGRWRGDMQLSTCAPGISGKVEMVRVKKAASPVIVVKGPDTQTIHANDFEGNSLIDELKDRKYYALIIGIDSYKDEKIQQLDNPVVDSRTLSETLNQYYTFEKEDITVLENPERSQIIENFDALSAKLTEKDQLLIFYAGHGIWDERLNQGFWLPSNASLNTKSEWLSNSTIRDYIGGIRSKHTLLITDACFSGSIFKERAVFTESRAMLEMYKLPSRKAMTSGALKTVPDKSVFIEYLNKHLIINDRPLISAEELFRGFKTAVINNSANGQVPQYGPIGQVGDEGGDFIFLRRLK